jgi:cytosine/adenosine deaminase-related metal-dependent hydrolase
MTPYLIKAKYVVTNPALREKGMLREAGILVQDTMIREVGDFLTLKHKHPEAQVLGSDHHIAIPGFINAHNHGQGATTFLRGAIDGRLETWIHFWPANIVRPEEEAYYDTLVAASRDIRTGITASMRHDELPGNLEEYKRETEAIIRGYTTAGIRFRFALGINDQFRLVYDHNENFIATLPPEMADLARKVSASGERISYEEFITYFEELVFQYKGDTRINLVMGVIGSQWDSDDLLLRAKEKARQLGTGMHGPLLESLYQKLYSFREFGHSGGEHFDKLGILGPDYSCAHGVWLTEKDIELFAKTGATVIHCPSSNLRFFDGIAPVTLMLEKGVNVALSPDSEGINDDEDMFQEMRLAMLLSRRPPVTTKSLDEWDVLTMATTNGARAILMQDKLGTLEPGKEADITLVNLERIYVPYMNPSIGPITALVYRGTPSDVDLVMVAGEVLYQEGHYLRFDVHAAEKKLGELMQKAYSSEAWTAQAMPVELIPYIEDYYKTWQIPELDPVYVMNSRR